MIAADRRSSSRVRSVGRGLSGPDAPHRYTETVAVPRSGGQAASRAFLRRVLAFSGMLVDLATCAFSASASYGIGLWLQARTQNPYPLREVAAASCLVGLAVVLLLLKDVGYRRGGRLLSVRQTEYAIRASAQSLLLLLPLSYLLKLRIPHVAFPISLVLTPTLLILQKHILSSILPKLHAPKHAAHRAVAYGDGESTEGNGQVPTPIAGRGAPWHYAIAKRTADLFVSSLLLVLLAPLLLLIGLMIRLDSPGPALFVQKRVGRNGRLFHIYKFRSMYTSAPRYDFSPATSFDPRITRLGRFLRRSCLDELPQLMNVLMGTMSLVGPRPEMPFIASNYNARQRQRLQVTPGITGLWQLSADRAMPIHENMEYDLYYIRKRGFCMDVAILIHTLFFAVGEGV
jgi:lipopolysaccharide/colanic/teichoic acid biosynthesis glycosyltransferase